MSQQNDLPSVPELESASCKSSGCSCCSGAFKASLFGAMFLVIGGLAAVEFFPDLADYGYPLIGKPSHIGFTGESPCASDPTCTAGTLHSKYPLLPLSTEDRSETSASTDSTGCCPTGRFCPVRAESSSESSLSGAVTAATPADDSPADAISAENDVDLDTPSH